MALHQAYICSCYVSNVSNVYVSKVLAAMCMRALCQLEYLNINQSAHLQQGLAFVLLAYITFGNAFETVGD